MNDHRPTLEDAKRTYAYIQGGLDHDEGYKPFYQVHEEAFDRMIAEVERAAAARALEEVANDLRVSFSRGAAIAMHHQCHKKQCRCGNPGNDEIVRAVFDVAREELRARAEAYRREWKD